MKKLAFLLAFILMGVNTYSQKNYKEFTGSSGVIKYSSQIVDEGERKGRLYIDLNTDGLTSLKLNGEKERLSFIEFLQSTYEKFKVWKQTAEENNVKEKLTKEIATKEIGNGLAFKRYSSGDWYISFNPIEITANMFINEEGEVMYFLMIPQEESYDNEFIESDRQIMIFEEEDINSLVGILENESINNFLNKKTAADLFN